MFFFLSYLSFRDLHGVHWGVILQVHSSTIRDVQGPGRTGKKMEEEGAPINRATDVDSSGIPPSGPRSDSLPLGRYLVSCSQYAGYNLHTL